jgi:hypothetical protein
MPRSRGRPLFGTKKVAVKVSKPKQKAALKKAKKKYKRAIIVYKILLTRTQRTTGQPFSASAGSYRFPGQD